MIAAGVATGVGFSNLKNFRTRIGFGLKFWVQTLGLGSGFRFLVQIFGLGFGFMF